MAAAAWLAVARRCRQQASAAMMVLPEHEPEPEPDPASSAIRSAAGLGEPTGSFGNVTIKTRELHHVTGAPAAPLADVTAAGAAAEAAVVGPCVALCGVVNPVNIGSTYRLMACMGFRTLRRIAGASDLSAVQTLGHAPSKQKLRSTSKSCERHVDTHSPMALDEFLSELRQSDSSSTELPNRLPIVAIETASGAVDIHSFSWPRDCTLMVGGESDGIPVSLVQELRPGYDHLVIIPMCGPHKSLNVATALAMAMFSYRGQHPGGCAPSDGSHLDLALHGS